MWKYKKIKENLIFNGILLVTGNVDNKKNIVYNY